MLSWQNFAFCILCLHQSLELQRSNSACFAEDEQFKEEKAVIIKEISMLEPMEQDDQF